MLLIPQYFIAFLFTAHFSYKNHKQWWEQATVEYLADDQIAVTKDVEENIIKECPKQEDEIGGDTESIEIPPAEEDQISSPKWRKVDMAPSNDGLSVEKPEFDEDGSCTTDVRMHSSDDEDIRDSNSEDDTEACITNRELEEVVQDVVRKRCGILGNLC